MIPEVIKTRKNNTWQRGTLAMIGNTALIVVIGSNNQMGTAGHDCPMGQVLDDGMETVFDRLYKDYGNAIDTKSGPDQRYVCVPFILSYPPLSLYLSFYVICLFLSISLKVFNTHTYNLFLFFLSRWCRDLFREGISFMKREYPLVDTLYGCVIV